MFTQIEEEPSQVHNMRAKIFHFFELFRLSLCLHYICLVWFKPYFGWKFIDVCLVICYISF